MVPRGLEPRTLPLLAARSNQLSYETSGDQDSCRSYFNFEKRQPAHANHAMLEKAL